ncbi:MAG: endonuclease/exonuclease/phosphatase family protein [Planctomycetota bacterium]
MRSLPRKIGRSLALGGTGLAAAILTAWLAGRIFSDRFVWSQWLSWTPTPAALVAAAAGLLAAVASGPPPRRRRRRLVPWAVGGGAILLYFATIEHRFFRGPADHGPGLRLVHLNVFPLWGRALQTAETERLLQLKGDLTILSNPVPPRGLERLLARLGETPPPVTILPFVLLTDRPVLEARSLIARDGIHVALFRVDTSDGLGRPIAVYAIDLPSDPRRSRGDVAYLTRRLLEQIDAPPPDIVVGDFNMTRGSASLQALFPDMRHAYDLAGGGYAASFPRSFPLYHLDHVLLAETLQATRYALVDPKLGRHLGQVVHLVPARPPE